MGKKKGRWPALGSHGLSGLPLAGAAATGDRLEDLGGVAVLIVFDKVADVDEALVAGEALGSGVSGWCGMVRGVHWLTPLGRGPGVL